MSAIDFMKGCAIFTWLCHISVHTFLFKICTNGVRIWEVPSHTLIWTRTPTFPCSKHHSIHFEKDPVYLWHPIFGCLSDLLHGVVLRNFSMTIYPLSEFWFCCVHYILVHNFSLSPLSFTPSLSFLRSVPLWVPQSELLADLLSGDLVSRGK